MFADWLDERGGPGDAARAEFIRLGVALPGASFWAPQQPVEGERPSPEETRAAEILGISLKTLHNKLNKLRLRPKKD